MGNFKLGTGFSADGAVICSDLTFSHLMAQRRLGTLSLGLVKLRPGADPDRVAAELTALLPEDVNVYTRPQINAQDRHHWIMKTSVGVIFGLGVILAVLVGVAIVYQVLSSDIDNRLAEYATLKAMGFSPSYLSWTVLQQAFMLAVGGFIPGSHHLANPLQHHFARGARAHAIDVSHGGRGVCAGGLDVHDIGNVGAAKSAKRRPGHVTIQLTKEPRHASLASAHSPGVGEPAAQPPAAADGRRRHRVCRAAVLHAVGLSRALYDSTVQVPIHLNADLVIFNRNATTITVKNPFSRQRLFVARACPGVVAAYPLYIDNRFSWKSGGQGRSYAIRALAFDPTQPVLTIPEVTSQASKLLLPDNVLFDRLSKSDYGYPQPGDQAQYVSDRVTVAGMFSLGTDFANDGNIVMSDITYVDGHFPLLSKRLLEQIDLGLVQLVPGTRRAAGRGRIEPHAAARCPRDDQGRVCEARTKFLENEHADWHRVWIRRGAGFCRRSDYLLPDPVF